MPMQYRQVSVSFQTKEELLKSSEELRMTYDKFMTLISDHRQIDKTLMLLLKFKGKYITERYIVSKSRIKGSCRARLDELVDMNIGITKAKGMYYTFQPRDVSSRTAVPIKTGTWRMLSRIKLAYMFPSLEDVILYLLYKNYSKVLHAKKQLERTDYKGVPEPETSGLDI